MINLTLYWPNKINQKQERLIEIKTIQLKEQPSVYKYLRDNTIENTVIYYTYFITYFMAHLLVLNTQ